MTKIHFIGIGGSGISGVAKLSKEFGYLVSGCDSQDDSPYFKDFSYGHSVDHVKDVDLVIASPAVYYSDKENEEVEEAKKLGKLITWQEFVGKYLQKNKKVIGISGTHGKSTTTAMVAKMLTDNGFDPSVIIGAVMAENNQNYRYGKGEYFVIEADEFYNNFLNYSPEIIILNNVEFDHPDFFKSEEEIFESFRKFIEKLKGAKILIANSDDPGVKNILKSLDSSVKVLNYSKTDNIEIPELKIFGRVNVSNAKGVKILGEYLGISSEGVDDSLSEFKGIGRRMERLKSKNGLIVFDDYAHHPTAIKETINALREKYPDQKIVAVDEPHGFARSYKLLENYRGVFDGADTAIIGPIFKARDKEDFGLTPETIAEKTQHKNTLGINNENELLKYLEQNLKSGDIVLIMGAGKSYSWARNIAGLDINK